MTKLDNDHLLLTTGPMGDRPKLKIKIHFLGKFCLLTKNKRTQDCFYGTQKSSGLVF